MAEVRTEIGWWGRALRHSFRVAKGWVIAYGLAWLLLGWWVQAASVVLVIAAALWLAVHLWRRFGPGPSLDDLERRLAQKRHAGRLASIWPALMVQLGCFVMDGHGNRIVPGFGRYAWEGSTFRMVIALPLGMSASDLARVSDVLTENLGANAVRVVPVHGGAELFVSYADALAATVILPLPTSVSLDAIPMGLREDGYLWQLRLGPQTLIAGASGSGKASLVWSFLLGLSPAIGSGLVEVLGVDLKGAMELTMGRALLTRFASTPELAVQLLEDAVRSMQARAGELAGITRQHEASGESPHVVVLIDELAALTAYLPDRELQRRANAAIALLCSQGRAVGYSVFACLQDPRKETIPSRGLFTRTIGLRLHDATETVMVLGEGVRESGALCHRISPTTPGVAYVIPEDGSTPIRVRAGFVDDDAIRAAAARFPAPRQVPVVLPEPAEPARRPRPRRRSSVMEGEEE